MACRGSIAALNERQLRTLLAIPEGEDRWYWMADGFYSDSEFRDEDVCELDKAWDHLHRCLNKQAERGEWIDEAAGEPPLKWLLFGGETLLPQELRDEYSLNLVTAERVPLVASALEAIDEAEMKRRFDAHAAGIYPGYDDAELKAYTLEYFSILKEFVRIQAAQRKALVFAVDH